MKFKLIAILLAVSLSGCGLFCKKQDSAKQAAGQSVPNVIQCSGCEY